MLLSNYDIGEKIVEAPYILGYRQARNWHFE